MLFQSQDERGLKYYKVRPVTVFSGAPMFTFSDRSDRSETSRGTILLSYPMYAKYAGYASVKDIKYERLSIKMKDDSLQSQMKLVDQLKKELS